MNMTGKFNAGIENIANAMKASNENYKIDTKIAQQEKMIKKMSQEIAKLTLVRLDAGDQMSPEIMERYAMIVEARKQIEALKQDKPVNHTKCPHCNAKNMLGMKYCGSCGEELETVE